MDQRLEVKMDLQLLSLCETRLLVYDVWIMAANGKVASIVSLSGKPDISFEASICIW